MSNLPYNREIRDLLDDLAELNPLVDPDELIAVWFDTLYFPAQTYISAKGQEEWRSCVTEVELVALAKFNEAFDRVVDSLWNAGKDWRESSGWKKVSVAAATALREIDVDA